MLGTSSNSLLAAMVTPRYECRLKMINLLAPLLDQLTAVLITYRRRARATQATMPNNIKMNALGSGTLGPGGAANMNDANVLVRVTSILPIDVLFFRNT